MELKKTQEILNKFGKYVVKQSRANLTRGKKNTSKRLYDSIDYELTVTDNSFGIQFIMEEYGAYQDEGVSGKKKKYNTPYSFKK